MPTSSGVVEQARSVARELLAGADGGRRWAHTQAVAARAGCAVAILLPDEGDSLLAAAWLHDVGYTRELAVHGFHSVDGAVFVRDELGLPEVAGLVAHHSGSRFLAAARRMGVLLAPFDEPRNWCGRLADALTWADQTTGPSGQAVTVEQRLQEVLDRHGPHSAHAACHLRRGPAVVTAVRATEGRLLAAGIAV